MATSLSGLWRGKKRRMVHKKSRRPKDWGLSPRRAAASERSGWLGFAAPGIKPDMGRRKLGARRKATVVETIFRWVKVPTGKVRRYRSR